MKAPYIIALLCVGLLVGCATSSNLSAEFDESVDFTKYKTYVLCIDDLYVENSQFPERDNKETRQLIADEVEYQLQRRGLMTNVLKPQLQAGFRIIVSQEEVVFTNCEEDSEYGYWKNCTLKQEVYTTETLVVYVSDIEKKQIIWQAKVDSDLNRPMSSLKDYVKNLVEELYNEYPEPPNDNRRIVSRYK